MSTTASIAKATFTAEGGSGKSLTVQFNPVSLKYTLTNKFKDQSKNQIVKQDVSQATGKLDMDLIFDNTHDGNNVRLATADLMALMKSPELAGAAGQKAATATIVLFEWGGFKFRGLIESYTETIDFFSASGVPLRATVHLSLAEQTKVFTATSANVDDQLKLDAVNVPNGTGTAATSLAAQGGNPNAARALGALNGQPSLRFGSGPDLTVTGSVKPSPPAAFANPGSDKNGTLPAGSPAANGAAQTLSTAAGRPVASRFGSAASARISAAQGAFAGLRTPVQSNNFAIETDRFVRLSQSLTVAASAGANFLTGGQATSAATPGLAADVGQSADLLSRIRFERD